MNSMTIKWKQDSNGKWFKVQGDQPFRSEHPEPEPDTVVRNIDAAKLAHANGEGDGREVDGVQ